MASDASMAALPCALLPSGPLWHGYRPWWRQGQVAAMELGVLHCWSKWGVPWGGWQL